MLANTASDPVLKSFVSTRLLLNRMSDTEAQDALSFLGASEAVEAVHDTALPAELAAA